MSINDDLADSEYGDDFIEQEESCFSDTTSEKYDAKADKRAHHNALERKRRDHIKDSFSSLKSAVPTFNGEKASRAQILKKAAEYINLMRTKNNDHQRDIDCLKKENKVLEEKIRALEQMKNGNVSLNSSMDQVNTDSFGNIVELDNSLSGNVGLVMDDNLNLMNQSDQRTNKKLVTSTAYITNSNQLNNVASNSPKRRKV